MVFRCKGTGQTPQMIQIIQILTSVKMQKYKKLLSHGLKDRIVCVRNTEINKRIMSLDSYKSCLEVYSQSQSWHSNEVQQPPKC